MTPSTPVRSRGARLLALGLASLLCSKPIVTHADDIDIFVGSSAGASGNPRVLIVLDNTSNWARQNQKWPDGASQGQSEAAAIREVIGDLDDTVNVGLMEFVTAGNANDNGGFVRHAVAPLDTTNKTALSTKLTNIYNGINSPDEKRNSNTPYGNLMLDVYGYLSGGSSYSPGGVLASIADTNGYTTAFSRFKAPITSDGTCGKTFMIFVSNPNASGPASDSAANSAALASANGGPVSQLRLQGFEFKEVASTTRVGATSACYASPSAAAAELPAFANRCATYGEGCTIGAPTAPSAPLACPSGTRTYTVVQSVYTPPSSSGGSAGTPVQGTTTTTTAPSTGLYSAAGEVPSSDTGGMSCPASTSTTSNGVTTSTAYSCSFSAGAPIGSATPATSRATTSACYSGVGTASGNWNPASSTDRGGLTCPANSTCTYSGVLNNGASGCGGNSGTRKVSVTQTATPKRKFTISMAATPTTTSSSGGVITPARTTTKVLGSTSACHASGPAAPTGDYAAECSGTNISCTYNNNPTGSTTASCPAGTSIYTVEGRDVTVETTETSAYSTDTGPRNADEWARLMYEKGIAVEGSTIRPSVTTYTIDVYNAQQNAEHTSLMMSMARAGGGKYFAARNQAAIVDALRKIMIEIQAVNTAFASTSLPVNATNRSQNENQVFIGMFRPDPRARPRWFGNLKRYQLITSGGNVELGDVDGDLAVNPVTGFITPCATSWWSSDSKDYWAMAGLDPVPKGTCTTSGLDPFSDAPDGPLVEKGAAAQILRQGNVGGADSGVRTLKRSVLTEHGGAMADFTAATSGLSESLVDFIRGEDVNNERGLGKLEEVRPSVHGDVIHSRPLPVNYGTRGVTVYYGANDGTLHAVDADSGVERWAFVAPEFYPRLARLKDNSPLVNYPNIKADLVSPTPTRKDYFFDGSIGLYQDATSSKVLIFPTMRRGGRMIYALDVSTPGSPKFAWKAGCPGSGTEGCTAGMEGIGQTWSIPNVAFIKGFSSTVPVVVVGGGYDNCEDQDSAAPDCTGTRGNKIYVLNALTGALIKSFDTGRGVAADVSMVDINGDGSPDYAYAADIGGTIYRIDFIDSPSSRKPLAPSAWTSRAVASTGGGRKFLFAPALLGNQTRVYVAIGSGDREHALETQYAYKSVTNRFFVYKDDLTRTEGAVDLDGLSDHTLKNACNAPMVLPDSELQGWYIDLNQNGQGEQTVTSALIATGMVTFSTNRPTPAKAGTCSTTLGEAGGYWLNLFNGAGAIGVDAACGGQRRSVFIGGGLPPSPVMATVKVGDRVMSVVMGAAQRGSTGAKSANVAFSPQRVRPPIRSARKRAYSYTVSD